MRKKILLEKVFIVIKNLFTVKQSRVEANRVGNLCKRLGKPSFEALKTKATIDLKN